MTRQDRAIIMLVIGVAVAAASWFLLIKPKREEAAELQTRVERAQGTMDAATAKAAQAAAARAQYARDYATVARLGKAVPADDDIASLVYQLDASADETGVDFRAVTVADTNTGAAAPAAATEGEGKDDAGKDDKAAAASAAPGSLPGNVTTVPITLSFTGGYFQMTRFLRKVQRYTITTSGDIDVRGRLLSIDSVALTPGPGGFSQVMAEVTATAYRAPLAPVQSGAGTGGAATPASTTAPQGTTEPEAASSGTPAPPTAARMAK
jgi:Tfp pilus assembly protein PilO